jgi:hypothetical protein
MTGMQTEFEFLLPRGYLDSQGKIHRSGTMRLANAMDEITPLRDPRVRNNQAYLSVILLARVITRLGTLNYSEITTDVIEKLFAHDLAYLQAFYNRINSTPPEEPLCPTCGHVLGAEATSLHLQERNLEVVANSGGL